MKDNARRGCPQGNPSPPHFPLNSLRVASPADLHGHSTAIMSFGRGDKSLRHRIWRNTCLKLGFALTKNKSCQPPGSVALASTDPGRLVYFPCRCSFPDCSYLKTTKAVREAVAGATRQRALPFAEVYVICQRQLVQREKGGKGCHVGSCRVLSSVRAALP